MMMLFGELLRSLEKNIPNIYVHFSFQEHMEGMPYDFTYGVEDDESGNKYSHVESSDGKITQGEYRVLLPDGRTQVSMEYLYYG